MRSSATGGGRLPQVSKHPRTERNSLVRYHHGDTLDVNADEWDAAKVSGSSSATNGHTQGFTFDYTAIGTQVRPTDSGFRMA